MIRRITLRFLIAVFSLSCGLAWMPMASVAQDQKPAEATAPAAAPAPAAGIVSKESVDNPYGLAALWAQGDFVAKGTLVILVLMSMGMVMLPPALVSLPFKLLLFVLVDGWHLLAQALALSFA